MRTKSLLIPLAIASVSAAAPAFADFNGGDMIVRVGAAYIETDDDVLSDVSVFDVDDPAADPDVEPIPQIPLTVANYIDLDDDTTWFINGTFFVVDHWAVELYHMNGADLSSGLATSISSPGYGEWVAVGGFGDLETSVTSFFVDWYPVCVESWIQPYIGVGFNYTDIEQDYLRRGPAVDDFPASGLVSFGSSFGWAAQIGVDIELGRGNNWLVNASAMYVDADPEIELGFNGLDVTTFDAWPVRVKDDLEYDSWIFNLGVGYKFSF